MSERALLGRKLGTWCPAPLTVANVRSPLYTSVYPPTCHTKLENYAKFLGLYCGNQWLNQKEQPLVLFRQCYIRVHHSSLHNESHPLLKKGISIVPKVLNLLIIVGPSKASSQPNPLVDAFCSLILGLWWMM